LRHSASAAIAPQLALVKHVVVMGEGDLRPFPKSERVTVTAGVPTVWTGLLHHLEMTRCDLSSLRLVTVGGSATSISMIERFKSLAGVDVVQGWGMTRLLPGTHFADNGCPGASARGS
jgi:acyl-CoA synthetase (AMP-forming)/AMP-acid ligase II